MSVYYFETDKFGVSDSGIHLLRSRYNYKTIEFKSVTEIYIRNGHQVNNWLLALIIGIALVLAGIYAGWNVLYDYFWGTRYNFYIEEFVVPVLPLFVGTYCIVVALRKGLVMEIVSESGTLKLPLEKAYKKSGIKGLTDFLNTNESTRHKMRMS
jgi:hypothetical protein